jgi:hypothetical protein
MDHASARAATIRVYWSPRPTIIGFGSSVRPNKLGPWQKDPIAWYLSKPNTARQQDPASLGHAWQKNPTIGYPSRPNDAIYI